MRTFFSGKTGIVILSVISLMALTFLAIGLKDLTFRPTLQFQRRVEGQAQFSMTGEMLERIAAVPFPTHLLAWGIFGLVVSLVASLLSPTLRKRLLRLFLRVALAALILTYLLQHDKLLPLIENLQSLSQASEKSNDTDLPEPPVFQPPQISPFLSYVISLGVALVLVGLAIIINRWREGQRQILTKEPLLDNIAAIARSSLDVISRGRDWEDVIINCYARMSQAASAKHGLHRRDSMTPREFASRLQSAGMPSDAVQHLTQLFESVRYGRGQSTQEEKDQAIACLTAILRSCGETA